MFVSTNTVKSRTDVHHRNTESLNTSPSIYFPHQSSLCYRYEIEYERQTESAILIFAQHAVSNEQFVIKMLREYKDTRYNLDTISKRQECQLEALRWNNIITTDFYIGLARVCTWEPRQRFITLDEIMNNPTKEMLDPDAEYVLIMDRLPDIWRLDFILCSEDENLLECYTHFLTKHVFEMHTHLDTLSIEDGIRWSGFDQLQRKLLHNLALADPTFDVVEVDRNNSHNNRTEIFNNLKFCLFQVLTNNKYLQHFEQRVQEQRIKRCHGDLKAPNIWIKPYFWRGNDKEPWNNIWILDTIDFNPSYCHIDVLSDLAMLVIDIHARTKSPELASLIVEDYLEYSSQQDDTSRSVLAYYLVEKAFVSAAINFVYKNSPDLGWSYLEVAKMWMIDLKQRLST